MSKAPPKRYRISLTVKDTAMPVIFELLRDQATDFHMQEVLPHETFPSITKVRKDANGTEPRTRVDSYAWALKMWPEFEPLLKEIAAGDQEIYYQDPRLHRLMESKGHSSNSTGAVLSAFERKGRLTRLRRGYYAMRQP